MFIVALSSAQNALTNEWQRRSKSLIINIYKLENVLSVVEAGQETKSKQSGLQ